MARNKSRSKDDPVYPSTKKDLHCRYCSGALLRHLQAVVGDDVFSSIRRGNAEGPKVPYQLWKSERGSLISHHLWRGTLIAINYSFNLHKGVKSPRIRNTNLKSVEVLKITEINKNH